MKEFETFNENASGWIFEIVLDLQLHTVEIYSTKF